MCDEDDGDISGALHFDPLSFYKEATAGYIAGYVIRMVQRSIRCATCSVALYHDGIDATTSNYAF